MDFVPSDRRRQVKAELDVLRGKKTVRFAESERVNPSQIDRSKSLLGAAMFQSPSAETSANNNDDNGSCAGTGSARLNPLCTIVRTTRPIFDWN